MAAAEHAACCSFRADEAAAFAVRTYARPQQLHSLESESDDMRGDTSLVLLHTALLRTAHDGAAAARSGTVNAAAQSVLLKLGEGRLRSTENCDQHCALLCSVSAPLRSAKHDGHRGKTSIFQHH